MSENAAYADDRVLAEFLRMPPNNGTVTKGVIPFTEDTISGSGTDIIANDPFSTVAPTGVGDRSVIVRPFRALISSLIAEGTDAKKSWRDIRSGVFVGSSTTRNGTVQLAAAHASLNRWDLVYAIVTPDADGSSVTRYKKDPTSGAVTSPTVVLNKNTTITLAKVTGTAASSPALPTIPADSATVFNIPLAYVRVAAGGGSGFGVLPSDILIAIPCIPMSRASGVSTVRPANGQFKPNKAGTATFSATTVGGLANWANNGLQPSTYLSPNSIGSEKLMIALDLSSGSIATWSVQQYGIIDDSRDWRKRLFVGIAQASFTSPTFSWQGSGTHYIPASAARLTDSTRIGTSVKMGQSFVSNMSGVGGFAGPNNGCSVWEGSQSELDFSAAHSIYLYVDDVTGALRFFSTGDPLALIFILLEAIGPLTGY